MLTADERRMERRNTWTFEKKMVQDNEPITAHLTTQERFMLIWQVTQDVWVFTGEPLYEPRSSRHIGRVLRGTG